MKNGAALALASVAALAAASAVRRRGSRSGCVGDYYHATTWAAAGRIATEGLRPRRGGGLFMHGGYDSYSQGRVFYAQGRDAALAWFGKVEDMANYHFQDDEEPDRLVPVLLRASGIDEEGLRDDDIGSADVPCSVYATTPLEAEGLEWWNPRRRRWEDMDTWGSVAAEAGLSDIEHYDESGDVVGAKEDWTSRGFTVFGPYDDGGFKPDLHDATAWRFEGVTGSPARRQWDPAYLSVMAEAGLRVQDYRHFVNYSLAKGRLHEDPTRYSIPAESMLAAKRLAEKIRKGGYVPGVAERITITSRPSSRAKIGAPFPWPPTPRIWGRRSLPQAPR